MERCTILKVGFFFPIRLVPILKFNKKMERQFPLWMCFIIISLIFLKCFDAQMTNFVIGGSNAGSTDFPYQASIRKHSHHICGGSIIGDQWILTAAHCLARTNITDCSILIGTNKLNSGGMVYYPKKYVIHSQFHNTPEDDIALIQLKDKIEFISKSIKIVQLTSVNTKPHTEVIASGWGYTNNNKKHKTPNILQRINLLTISNKQCAEAFTGIQISNGNLCTFTESGQGICQGDSGGPLVDAKSGKLVGIVSANIPCAKGYPDVYTRIHSYLYWIECNISD